MSETSAAVEFRDVRKTFGDFVALHGLSIDIPVGSVYGFIGPNGAGKTTAMRILTGISKADSGNVSVLGSEELDTVRPQIGYLPEEKGIYKRMRVRDFIAYLGRLKGMSHAISLTAADKLIERFKFDEWRFERCQGLSKGMSQQVQLMGTLVHDPELIIFDEPFSGLDPVNTEQVRDLILEVSESGKTVILSTHIMQQAEELCDELVLLNKGEAVVEGPLDQIRKGNFIKLSFEGDSDVLNEVEGVREVKLLGKTHQLELADQIDPSDVLSFLSSRVKISKFDTTAASLHDIFVREVGGDIDVEQEDA